MWSAAAPSWDLYADFVDERGSVVGAAMLAAADVRPGDQVLELGCGPGGLGFSADSALADFATETGFAIPGLSLVGVGRHGGAAGRAPVPGV
jgi:hypothetical protein